MIVLDDETGPDVKRPPERPGPSGEMSESSRLAQGPPPAYSEPQSYGTVHTSPLQYPDDVSTTNRPIRIERGENPRRRFLTAFAIAFGIWVLIVILVDSIGDLNQTAKRNPSPDSSSPQNPEGWPPKSDQRIRFPFCVVPPAGSSPEQSDKNSVKAGFALPVFSDLSFFSNDSFSYGSFAIDATESSTTDVEVDVVVSYQTQEALRRSKICLFEEGAKRTLGIMAAEEERNPPSTANLLRYDVYVRLPVSNKRPLFVSQLTADFPLFAIAVTDLAQRVEFGEIDLRTEVQIILAESLSARRAHLETSNAKITGNFTTSSSLELVTRNAPIDASVVMLSSASPDEPPTRLAMHTKNAAITANLDLTNPSTSSSSRSPPSSDFSHDPVGGTFKIESTTSNARSSISVDSQPYSSYLSLTAQTSNSACEVSLPQQFSGSFRLASTVMQPVLRISSPSTDKKHRKRGIKFTRVEQRFREGSITWFNGRGKKEQGDGFVDVSTSVLPAILNL